MGKTNPPSAICAADASAAQRAGPHIAVVGSLNMDLVVRTPRFPAPGETIFGHDFHTIPGGKGANQAVAAGRLGHAVIMVGSVGDDAFGERLRANLAENGVDAGHVTVNCQAATGVALIAVDDRGENCIVVASGANAQLSAQDVEQARPAIAGARALVLQLEVPLPTVRRAIDIARESGVTVILNPAPAQPLPAELLADVDYLIPNENEASLLTGADPSRPEEAAQALRAAGARNVIVTLGARGALLADESGTLLVPGFQVDAVDTTAAGDAFVGAFVVALSEGKAGIEAVQWANSAGALATTVLGAQPSLPTHAAVAELLADRLGRM